MCVVSLIFYRQACYLPHNMIGSKPPHNTCLYYCIACQQKCNWSGGKGRRKTCLQILQHSCSRRLRERTYRQAICCSYPPWRYWYVFQSPSFTNVHSPLHFSLVWYGKYKNRGFISPLTLKKLEGMPFVEERWKDLANQLGRWKKQQIIVKSD